MSNISSSAYTSHTPQFFLIRCWYIVEVARQCHPNATPPVQHTQHTHSPPHWENLSRLCLALQDPAQCLRKKWMTCPANYFAILLSHFGQFWEKCTQTGNYFWLSSFSKHSFAFLGKSNSFQLKKFKKFQFTIAHGDQGN